jgi:hypothetical protein
VSDRPFPERTNDRRVFWSLVVGLVVLFGGLYVAGYQFTSDKLPRNTTISGVDLGGLTTQAAEARFAQAMQGRVAEPIVVSASGRRAAIDPGRAGMTVDVDASVAQAGAGRSWRPDRMWNFLSGGHEYDAVVHVDGALLRKAIASFAATIDRPARNGAVSFKDGEVSTTDPTTGSVLDRTDAATTIRDAFPTSNGPLPLAVRQIDPEISERDVTRAMNEFANPAMAAPVTFEIGRRTVVLQPQDYSSAISLVPHDGALVPTLDDRALISEIRSALKGARFSFDETDVTGKFLDLVGAHGSRTQRVSTVVTCPSPCR